MANNFPLFNHYLKRVEKKMEYQHITTDEKEEILANALKDQEQKYQI